jgi:hypothetical protein
MNETNLTALFSETFDKICEYMAVEVACMSLHGEKYGYKFVAVSAHDRYQMYVPDLKLRFEKSKAE